MIRFWLNGRAAELEEANGLRSLLSVLRDDLDQRAAKPACGEGRCGACTVVVDDRAAESAR